MYSLIVSHRESQQKELKRGEHMKWQSLAAGKASDRCPAGTEASRPPTEGADVGTKKVEMKAEPQ